MVAGVKVSELGSKKPASKSVNIATVLKNEGHEVKFLGLS